MNNNGNGYGSGYNNAGNNANSRVMNDLIGKASQKIGANPNELKKQIENGKLEDIMRSLPPQQAKTFQSILSNPELAKKMMDTPQAQNLMRQFFSK